MAIQTSLTPGSGYGNDYIDSLIWGCQWINDGSPTYGQASVSDPVVINFSFSDEGSYTSFTTGGLFQSYSWLDPEKSAIESAMASYEAVCNVQFNEVPLDDGTEMYLNIVDNGFLGSSTLGLFEVPDDSFPYTQGYFNGFHSSWNDTLYPGSFGYITILHELGHGLGLAHPHDGGDEPDATQFPGVSNASDLGTFDLNQGIWTTMTYNDGYDLRPPSTYDYGYQFTPMAFDIAALQAIYGANTTTATGNNFYTLPNANTSFIGWSCIWDAGGTDYISNSGSALSCLIDLREAPLTGTYAGGYVSMASGIVGGYTIANGVEIENALGGNAADSIYGNQLGNEIYGYDGADYLYGFGGADNIYGGDDNDQIYGHSGNDNLFGDAGNDYVYGAKGNDVIYGGADGDYLYGNAGSDTISGQLGNDYIWGGFGVDVLYGNAGADYIYGENHDDLIFGGKNNDVLYGNAGSDSIYGNAGTDTIYGGEGDDIINGQLGVDTLYGEGGYDYFQFNTALGSGQYDTIKDFTQNEDTIRLDATIFTSLAGDGNLSDNIISSGLWSLSQDSNDYLIYNPYNGYLYYDADGSASAHSAILFAIIENFEDQSGGLDASDFAVY